MPVNCPLPLCLFIGDRQTHVNAHLRSYHEVPLEKGAAGNIKALQNRQQQDFSRWLRRNNLPNRSLFGGGPIVQDQDEDDTDEDNADDDGDDDDDDYSLDINKEEEGEGEGEDEGIDDDARDEGEEYDVRDAESNGTDDVGADAAVVPVRTQLEIFIEDSPDQSGLDVRPTHENDSHLIRGIDDAPDDPYDMK